MARKPSKTRTVKLPWSLYKEITDEAVDRDIPISEVLAEKVTMAKEMAENKATGAKEGDSNSESNYVCEFEGCGKSFESKKKLEAHKTGAGHR